jgi:nicotinate-nucleotide pyrophosphorylase (carboxylating)
MQILPSDEMIALWFREDIGAADHTTLGTIPAGARGSAKLLVKESGIVAGVEIAKLIFRKSDPALKVTVYIPDGSPIKNGDVVLKAEGNVRSILQSERLVLNVMQRMSGIATETSKYVKEIEGTGTKVLDTRKTTPGFRQLEKEAVRIGGGFNHRQGLYDMIMIKDNHIDFAGGIERAIEGVVKYLEEKQLYLKIEVEVRSLNDIRKVLNCNHKIDRILLDNFTVEMTREAVRLIDGRSETESSGNINLKTIRSFAECGVDFVSAGALTHQIKSLDLSLKADF